MKIKLQAKQSAGNKNTEIAGMVREDILEVNTMKTIIETTKVSAILTKSSGSKRRRTAAVMAVLALNALVSSPLYARHVSAWPELGSADLGQQATGQQSSGQSDGADQAVRRTVEASTFHFQAGENYFKDGNFDRARREYDRAIDVILESGLDVRAVPALRQHYIRLIEAIHQRQMTLVATAQPAEDEAVEGESGRGFGTQVFTSSPLDELAKIDLNVDETSGATEEVARKSVVEAKVDFGFRPNALIQSYINYYQGRGRVTMEQGLRRSGRFIDMARQIFQEEGVPQDLVWLCQVESAWSPVARSWASAVGLWQFIAGTGTRFGLHIDSWVDERCSFEKATRASARYLRFLGDRFDGNWELAMAAYNTGEARIDSAIARSGYADFWEIYDRGLIPRETRNYVPNILATIIIAKNPDRYGFTVTPEPPLTYDFVKVNNLVDLRLVADATGTTPELINALNPELKRGATPPSTDYLLRVPAGKGRELKATLTRIPVEKRASWRVLTASADDSFESIARRTGVSVSLLEEVNGSVIPGDGKVVIPASNSVRNVVLTSPRSDRKESSVASSSRTRGKYISYRVRRGETLGDIAGRYNTSVGVLSSLNGIGKRSTLRIGQALKVPVR